MFRKPTLERCLEQLGAQLVDEIDIKAVMMSKSDDGDILITLVEGIEDSHKVRFGCVESRSRVLVRFDSLPKRHRRDEPAVGSSVVREA